MEDDYRCYLRCNWETVSIFRKTDAELSFIVTHSSSVEWFRNRSEHPKKAILWF